MTIQNITIADLPALAALFEELTGQTTEPEAMNQNYKTLCENKDYYLLGAKDEKGKLMGSMMGIICTDLVGDGRPFMVVENVIVAAEARGKGAGRLLMAALEDIARQHRCTYIMLVSGEKRKEAHKFYEALGYGENPARGFKKLLQY